MSQAEDATIQPSDAGELRGRVAAVWTRPETVLDDIQREKVINSYSGHYIAILLDKSHKEIAVGCEILLYMASRTQLMAEVIAPALDPLANVYVQAVGRKFPTKSEFLAIL